MVFIGFKTASAQKFLTFKYWLLLVCCAYLIAQDTDRVTSTTQKGNT